MTNKQMRSVLLMGMLQAAAYASGKPGSCADIPVTVEISTDPSNAIRGDLMGVYKDSVDQVKAIINLCSGSGDMVMLTSSSATRSIAYSFPGHQLSGSNAAPAWTQDSRYAPWFGKGELNIRELVDPTTYPANAGPATFTSTLGTSFKGPDDIDYGFRMVNPCADNPPRQAWDWLNMPSLNSRVIVEHSGTPGSAGEAWVVYADPSPIGCVQTPAVPSPSLGLLFSSRGRTQTNVGQFTMPFYLTIRRKQ